MAMSKPTDSIFEWPIVGPIFRLVFSESLHVLCVWFIGIGIGLLGLSKHTHFGGLSIAGWTLIIIGAIPFIILILLVPLLLLLEKLD
jgi:hypothetical protein